MSNSELAIKIVKLFNPEMGGIWASKMYEQKELEDIIDRRLNKNKEDE